jgi:hypothetical protein
MRRTALVFVALALASTSTVTNAQSGYMPPKGFVPDAATATAIARAVLIPIYGAEHIRGEEPLVATREGDVWTVNGTLHCGATISSNCVGGTARVKLSAKDGRILFLIRYK